MRQKNYHNIHFQGMCFIEHTACNSRAHPCYFSDGEHLAWQVVPLLPDNRTKISVGCLSASSARCRAISYVTLESPESVINSWPGFNTRTDSDNGTIYYNYEACNYNILGINYAVLHTYPHPSFGSSCTYVTVHYDQEEEFDAFNSVRNNQSFAHDNPILNYSESILIVNYVASAIKFLQSIEGEEFVHPSVSPQSESDWDEIPF